MKRALLSADRNGTGTGPDAGSAMPRARGLNLEDTRLREPRKLGPLMTLAALTTAWAGRNGRRSLRTREPAAESPWILRPTLVPRRCATPEPRGSAKLTREAQGSDRRPTACSLHSARKRQHGPMSKGKSPPDRIVGTRTITAVFNCRLDICNDRPETHPPGRQRACVYGPPWRGRPDRYHWRGSDRYS